MIIVDIRENRHLKKALADLGTQVSEETITVGDYVVSEECAVERKQFDDFMKSIYDGRLFEQAERLSEGYSKPILLVEGNITRVLTALPHPRSFWGALAKAVADYDLQVVCTPNMEHTAFFLHSLAEKLQSSKDHIRFTAKHNPRVHTLADRQIFSVQSLPHIGPKRAVEMLGKFGSVRRVFEASRSELQTVEGLGDKAATEITELLDAEYGRSS